MKSLSHNGLRGRVLVVAGKDASGELVEKLSTRGYFCTAAHTAGAVLSAAAKLKPEAILLSTPAAVAAEALAVIRGSDALKGVPVLADLTRSRSEAFKKLDVEDWVRSTDELTRRLEAALRGKRLVEREEATRRRMEALLEITQAATSSLELEQILAIAVDKISKVVPSDRCSVVLVEGQGPRVARVVASRERRDSTPFPIDLARYPELRKALETRATVHVEDATRDPLMAEVRRDIAPLNVRSVLVQPLLSHDEMLGALFLRLSRTDDAFSRDDQAFAVAAAGAIANSVRNARLHAALRRKREDLESAYVDRYRELTEANQRLKELHRLKDDVIAVCSHDLRAPLQVLLGHGRLLADAGLEGDQKVSAEAIVRVGKKVLSLIERLLDQSRGASVRPTLEPTTVDVSELCKEAASELAILARERGVTLRAETPESLFAIGDEVKLRQVLQNLITNAIQHARDAGAVVVRTQRVKAPEGDSARVVVQDDGKGIPPDQVHVIFDKYRHGSGTGTGLGLAICKEYVELHGGEIWAESPPGGGGSFVFTLPLAKSDQPEAAPLPAPSAPDRLRRVLIIEDEPELAAVMAEMLKSRYRVELARDGAEGVAMARALKPDLIVTDIFLPKLDGLDAAVALKASTDTADIPIIFLSAHQGVSDKVRALNLGAVDYLGKPFQGLELLARVDRALRLRDTERELERSRSLLRSGGHDPETGTLNLPGLVARLNQELARTLRYQRPLALAALVPSTPPGDKLRLAVQAMRSRMRASDLLAHVGNGALVAVHPESQADGIALTYQRILAEVEAQSGVRFRISVMDLKRKPLESLEAAVEALVQRASDASRPRM